MSDVLLLLFVSSMQFTNPGAASKALEAYYKQTGSERAIQDWIDRETTRELRAKVGQLSFITKTIVEQKITVEWRFP